MLRHTVPCQLDQSATQVDSARDDGVTLLLRPPDHIRCQQTVRTTHVEKLAIAVDSVDQRGSLCNPTFSAPRETGLNDRVI
jgi:hypothetical protein